MQDVVELQRYGERSAFEEALSDLRVPDEFVGVHRLIVEPAPAVHVHVGRERGAPRCCYVDGATVCKAPGVEVALALQVVARVGVVE